ncbi:hypothetical protein QBC44DRAFT_364186 [Cladorrhinum sp. PSN332]|nr:hypothetical protein QBC44DRAFT_364186 [Cladorrhinum sp. PSN332]
MPFQMRQRPRAHFSRVDNATRAKTLIAGIARISNNWFDYVNWIGDPLQPNLDANRTVGAELASKRVILEVSAALDPNLNLRCLNCHLDVGNAACDLNCYKAFRDNQFRKGGLKVEIQQADPANPAMGDGVFVKPGRRIRKSEWIGEYIGRVCPNAPPGSFYTYELKPEINRGHLFPLAVVDSSIEGNWTRYMNHRCMPNVRALSTTIGKIRLIAFQARRDIGAGEQLHINYGESYFTNLGMLCRCDTFGAGPHAAMSEDDAVIHRVANNQDDSDSEGEVDSDESQNYSPTPTKKRNRDMRRVGM